MDTMTNHFTPAAHARTRGVITIPYRKVTTVYPRSEAAATNCFTLQIKEATIRGRLLNESGDY